MYKNRETSLSVFAPKKPTDKKKVQETVIILLCTQLTHTHNTHTTPHHLPLAKMKVYFVPLLACISGAFAAPAAPDARAVEASPGLVGGLIGGLLGSKLGAAAEAAEAANKTMARRQDTDKLYKKSNETASQEKRQLDGLGLAQLLSGLKGSSGGAAAASPQTGSGTLLGGLGVTELLGAIGDLQKLKGAAAAAAPAQ